MGMMESLRFGALLAVLAASGCTLGDGPTGGIDDRDDVLGIECNATFETSGTFAGEPQPDDIDGCWPVGTWTFTASMDSNECATPPALQEEYEFVVEDLIDEQGNEQRTYMYLTEPTANYRLKVTSGGGGLCEGGLEIFSEDGKQFWNFKPALNADASITGFGEYALYREDQWN